ncbi:hypothetical protein [Sphingomonas sp. NFR15]|uniref:hypothetical protein n=1 Tax=Sphingomonas sp. NFR15 TaxID=1566282 RepID=UPI0008866AD9|nr:hypothetical protein [Sphingomonas sp. NFR15]SDA14926.1 hypothetical protein SAMN03159340_00614 [Sphingomonas sp. NFR15]
MRWKVEPQRGASPGPYRRDLGGRLARAAARATDRAAFGARDDIRQEMRSQRLGNLANAIGATSDLKKGKVPSGLGRGFDVAGFVYARIKSSRTAGALRAYVDQDTTDIAPVRGKYLWIATSEIPRKAGRRRMTPELYRATGLENSIGPLVFIKGRHFGEAFYVVKDTTIQLARSGKARRLPKRGKVGAGRARVGIVAFVGIRRTRRQRRVNPRQIAAARQRAMAQLLGKELN